MQNVVGIRFGLVGTVKRLVSSSKALNDDLSTTLTIHQVAETRSKTDCPINDPDAILHNNVLWTIMG